MRILVEGSGGSAGWPEPGCRCASCLRQAAAGNARSQSTIVVDGRLRFGAEVEAGDGKAGAGNAGAGNAGAGNAGAGNAGAGQLEPDFSQPMQGLIVSD